MYTVSCCCFFSRKHLSCTQFLVVFLVGNISRVHSLLVGFFSRKHLSCTQFLVVVFLLTNS